MRTGKAVALDDPGTPGHLSRAVRVPGFLPPRDPLARFTTALEENDLHEPTHSDLLFAIWTVLALPDPDSDPGVDDAVLSELFDDLHLDLQRVQRSWCDERIEDDEEWAGYEELAIALP